MQVTEVTPSEAIALIASGSVFFDVREEHEIAELAYDIANKTEIPLGEIQVRLADFPKDKNIIIGCRSGKRSMQACMFLKMSGYENVQNLQGGIIAWTEGGFPTK
jgi:rhodanese-related sulfurtransferase